MIRRNYRWIRSILLLVVCVPLPRVAMAHDPAPSAAYILEHVRFEQNLNSALPLDLEFVDDQGRAVRLGHYFQDKPVLLALTYFACPTLCPLVRTGLVESLRPLSFDVGQEFEVLVVSIDPREETRNATAAKAQALIEYGRPESAAGWHFLTGEHEAIDRLADAIGFYFAYDGEQEQYAHPSGIILLTPEGRISRYFYGIEYPSQDLRLGMVEASQNKIGSPIDRLLLLCYIYDPITGKYSLLIMRIVRIAGLATVAGMGAFIYLMWRKESHHQPVSGAG